MSSQASRILDTIAAMKRAIHDEHGFTDSDDEAPKPTNRGYKLKRKAEYFHEGELGGRRPYKKRIDHRGFERYILRRNPKRYDEYGYELDDEDEDEEADQEAADKNPYNEVLIERLLMPLTAASDLADHPAMSIPYKSQILPDMIKQTREGLLKERRMLADLKLLLTRFRGDQTWIPVERLYTESDAELFMSGIRSADELLPADALALLNGSTQVRELSVPNGVVEPSTESGLTEHAPDVPSLAIEGDEAEEREATEGQAEAPLGPNDAGRRNVADGTGTSPDFARSQEEVIKPDPPTLSIEDIPTNNLQQQVNGIESDEENHPSATNKHNGPRSAGDDEAMEDASPPPRMLTRGQAQAQVTAASNNSNGSSRSRTASPASPVAAIHPLFIPPISALADRDCGLNPIAADETRRLLSATVQKQEETVRLLERMYDGLLKAERLRKSVWSWCRAEGHADDLSDNEDYVDLEEWGLDSPLVKGQEDVDESGEKEGKKTRGGRRGAQ